MGSNQAGTIEIIDVCHGNNFDTYFENDMVPISPLHDATTNDITSNTDSVFVFPTMEYWFKTSESWSSYFST